MPSDDGSFIPVAPVKKSEWDYWLAIVILTVLAFATRFYRIDYPNEVVFDEVHFGKVGGSTALGQSRKFWKGDSWLTRTIASSLPTTSNVPISSMSTLPLENCCLLSWAG